MKRLLATIITLAMVLSLVPAAFAADLEAKTYTLDNSVIGGQSAKLSTVTDYGTRGWMFFGYDGDVTESSTSGNKQVGYVAGSTYGLMFNNKDAGSGAVTFALSLEAPSESGFYIPSTTWQPYSSKDAALNMYVGKESTDLTTVAQYTTSQNSVMSATGTDGNSKQTDYASKAVYTTSADKLVVAYETESQNYRFYNITLNPINNAKLEITADKAVDGKIAFSTTDTDKNAVITSTKVSGTDVDPMDIGNGFVEYKSDNTAVATVDANGTIIAGNTAGTAKIYAQSTDGKVKSNEITVTVSEPQPEEKTYTLDNTVIGGSSAKLSTVTDYGTRGWMFFGYDGDVTESNASGNKQVGYVASSANGLMFNNSNAGTGAVTFALLLETPAGRGFYIPSTNWTPVDTGAKFDMFVGKKSATSSSVSDYVVEKNKGMSATGKTGYTAQTDSAKAIYTTSADELVVAYKTENSNYRFHNISLTPIMVPELTITADKAELDTADNKTATISATVKETGSETSVAVANNFITYHSDNTAVATVSADGTITAVGEGTAKITAQSPDSKVKSNEITVTVTELEDAPDITAAFTPDNTDDITDSYVAPSVAGLTDNGAIAPVANGDGTYKITADETKNGAKFLYWAKGMTTQKKIISFSNIIENYVPEEDGRNFLIAVYEDEVSGVAEYYNANGQLIPGATQETKVSMAGYGTSNGWDRYEDTNIHVAHYDLEEPAKNIDITVTNGSGSGTYAYGDKVTCVANSGENFKCWKKNGEIVSRDTTYTFKAWERCEIVAVNEAHTYNGSTMKIIIDSFTAGSEIGVMAEFIGLGNAVEKGIIFNDGTKETKIAMTKPGTQFSVIADTEGTYIGYAILRNGSAYTLITDGLYTKSN